MAADVSEKQAPLNPCCQLWRDRYSKLQEKRNALRQALKLFEQQLDKIEADNLALKTACEEEQARAEVEKEGREKELAARVSLESEISALKSEISTLQQKGRSHTQDNMPSSSSKRPYSFDPGILLGERDLYANFQELSAIMDGDKDDPIQEKIAFFDHSLLEYLKENKKDKANLHRIIREQNVEIVKLETTLKEKENIEKEGEAEQENIYIFIKAELGKIQHLLDTLSK